MLDAKPSELEAERAVDDIDAQYFIGTEEYLERYRKWFEHMYPDEEWSSYKLGSLEGLSSNRDGW